MAALQQFTLAQLKQLIEGNDEQLVGNYISQNLVIARNVRISFVRAQLSDIPTVMPEMRMFIVRQGWAMPIINLIGRRYEAGDLVFLSPNTIFQHRELSNDLQGIGISMSDDLFSLAIGNRIPKAFDGHLRDFCIHLQPEEQEFLDHLHYLIYTHTREGGRSSQVTLHLISAFLWYADRLWNRHETSSRQTQTREQRLFSDFIQLVNQHATQQHTIDFYAGQLFISPRYMSTIIKRVGGKAAKEWIDDAILTRIKIELKHSSKQVAQISDEMNFPNPSFFSKYFKRLTGITPGEYRQQAE